MISILFTYTDKEILKEVMKGTDENPSPFTPHDPIPVAEMIDDCWHVYLEPEQVTPLEAALKQPPLKMIFIGSYNNDGSQYIWTEPTEIQRIHNINHYANKLKPKQILDDEGNVIDEIPYTEEEALGVQVNKIAGYPDRVL